MESLQVSCVICLDNTMRLGIDLESVGGGGGVMNLTFPLFLPEDRIK